jgi:hypothetical protein
LLVNFERRPVVQIRRLPANGDDAIDVEGYSFDQLVARAGDAGIIKAQMLAAIAPRR